MHIVETIMTTHRNIIMYLFSRCCMFLYLVIMLNRTPANHKRRMELISLETNDNTEDVWQEILRRQVISLTEYPSPYLMSYITIILVDMPYDISEKAKLFKIN